MVRFVAKRIRFRNGERHSILSRVGGLPVHEVTLFLSGFRKSGRAANTLHSVCIILALFYRWLHDSRIDLLERLRQGGFLSAPELSRLADAVQYRIDDLADDDAVSVSGRQVINLNTVRSNRKPARTTRVSVSAQTQATRLRYIAMYLDYLARYVGATLPPELTIQLKEQSDQGLKVLLGQLPKVSIRIRVGAREGMSQEAQDQLLAVVDPDSPNNPWKRGFVRHRNWLIVVILLATGMRRGELLNLQIGDLEQREPKLHILRRPDTNSDRRALQPTPKTRERTIELQPSIMKAIWQHIAMRQELKGAKKHPYLFVSEDGRELSYKAIDKIFLEIRGACVGLDIRLSSHVMRHTWNDRFSEVAERMGLKEGIEERARNEQQGWTDNSKSAATYTRRFASQKGREIALEMQKKLDVQDK